MKQELAIVLPVYEDAGAFRILMAEVRRVLGSAVYIIAVDDGSVHVPLSPNMIHEAGLAGVVIRLIRNMGHQRAIAIGLSYIAEDVDVENIVIMDADGEDEPSAIPHLLSNFADEATDVVVARRGERSENLQFKIFYSVYKRIFKLLTGRRLDFGNFMAVRGTKLKRLVAMSELWIHVAGSVVASGLRLKRVPSDRGKRHTEQSKMSFVGLVLHGFRAMTVFTEDVLVRVGMFCAILSIGSLLAIAGALTLKVFGYATPGWVTTVTGISILMVLQTGTLTLMTLLTAGVIKSVSASPPNYKQFVHKILTTPPAIVALSQAGNRYNEVPEPPIELRTS
jgi:hypothetical protein